MPDTSATSYIAARGFWLPCDQAGFIHHERHKHLRASLDLRAFIKSNEPDTLDDQVFHRLAMVLPHWGYSQAIPVKHVSVPFGDDPDAAVFVHDHFTGEAATDYVPGVAPIAVPAHVRFDGLALLVNSSGFYLWLLRYRVAEGNHTHTMSVAVQEYLKRYIYEIVGGDFWTRYSGWKDDEPLATSDELDNSLLRYQNHHRGILTFVQINTIFEGLFNSALDFRVFFFDNASDRQGAITKAKQEYSLGAFLNLISAHVDETHYNDTASTPSPQPRPAIPADQTPPASSDAADGVDGGEPAGHSDAGTESAASHPTGSRARHRAITVFLHHLNSAYPHPQHHITAMPGTQGEEANRLCHDYLGEKGCAALLLKFLQSTASETLQNYKRRIERCRRALVSEILEVTQRQDGILQVEIPPAETSRQPEDETRDKNDRIEGVTEAQLRGYVMLYSAKLPLVNNVRLYLKEIVINNHWYTHPYRPGARSQSAKATNQVIPQDKNSQQVNAALKMWTTLYEALENDLFGLERAVEHEREDRMVQEEEKIRIEEETLAEIERLQDRNASSLSPQTSLTLGLLSNAFALASVIIALLSIVHSGGIPQVDFTHYTLSDLLEFLGAVLALGLGLIVLYFLAHYGFVVVFRSVIRLLHIRQSGRYYYEMDIHMEAPLDETRARELLDDRYQPPTFSGAFIEHVSRAHAHTDWAQHGMRFWDRVVRPAFQKPERNSYRVERQDANEAMHKVYVEVAAAVRRVHWYQFARPRINLVLVYEMLYHRPAQTPRFILKDLRVVSTQLAPLTATQLAQVKELIVVSFVNPLLRKGARPLELAEKNTDGGRVVLQDALLSLTGAESKRVAEDEPSTPQPDTPQAAGAESRGVGGALRLWLGWLARQLRASAWLLARVGLFGFALFVGRAVLNIVVLASDQGFAALVDGHTLLHALFLDEEKRFILAHLPWLILAPLATALLLRLAGLLVATYAGAVSAAVQRALLVSDEEEAERYKARHQMPGEANAPAQGDHEGQAPSSSESAAAENAAAATEASAPGAQDAGAEQRGAPEPPNPPDSSDPSGQPTALPEPPSTAWQAVLPWWWRAWRGAVVTVWILLGAAGRAAEWGALGVGFLVAAGLGSLGIAVAIPVMLEFARWLSAAPHP